MAEASVMAPAPPEPLRREYHGCSSIQAYDLEQKLGEGTFGEVYKARSRKTAQVFALKKILMHNEKDGFPITALREIKLLKRLSHANIIKLEEMAVERFKTDPHDKSRKRAILYMVFPYMHHDLSGLLDNPEVRLSEAHIKCYMQQLLRGLKYLHNSKILHRDMKAANLLINNRGILQIADFGLARHYDEPAPQPGKGNGEAQRDYTSLVVTRWYRPPELLLQLRRYTPAIDLWGAGCVFGEMFKRKPVLTGKSDLHQAEIIWDLVGTPNDQNMPGWQQLPGCDGMKTFVPRQGNINKVFSELGPEAMNLLKRLLTLDWRTRINAIDALEHPYFTTRPLPSRPEDIPWFNDSHELDRRNARGTQQALPPAPAGGAVGGGANGDWSSQPNDGGWRDDRRRGPPPDGGSGLVPPSRVPGGSRVPQRAYDDRGPPAARRPGWENERARPNEPPTRHPLPPRPSHEPEGFSRKPNIDSYVPSYGAGGRRDDRRSRERDDKPPPHDRDGRRPSWDYNRDSYRDRDRGDYYDRDRPVGDRARDRRTRSRSRSPRRDYRDARNRERDYRDRDRR